MNKLTGWHAYVLPGYLLTASLLALITVPPRLMQNFYLNLASTALAPGYVVNGRATAGLPAQSAQSDVSGALRFAAIALDLHPDHPAAWRITGRALWLDGQVPKAMTALANAARADANDVIAREAVASLHYTMGEFDKARDGWRSLPAPVQLVALGDALSDQGLWQAAVAAYETVIEVAPNFTDAYYPLGWARYVYLEDFRGALETFHAARELDPNRPWSYVNIGDLYASEDRFPEAISWYRRAMAVAPGEPGLDGKLAWSYASYGDRLLEKGRLSQAEQAYRRALEAAPDYVPAYHGLARLLWKGRNDPQAAKAAVQQAIALAPRDYRSYFLMSDLLAEEDPQAAAEWYQQAESIRRGIP